ncbi:uracil-DNA glycosylase [Edaphobacter sp. HDX4]|uniref:uracil-DNA glycosylase n=1 Tax=Edaphobacter sp. HDX4 TaxID=2794064 RepID=UPI002FE58FCB
MAGEAEQQLRAYVEYLRDLGIYNLYRRCEPDLGVVPDPVSQPLDLSEGGPAVGFASGSDQRAPQPSAVVVSKPAQSKLQPIAVTPPPKTQPSESEIPKLISFNDLAPLPEVRLAASDKAAALEIVREDIGDCTRCPLAYAGRRKIVFADGDPNARLMFVGEGPGADEDAQGLPFVGKAGQLLNNMISAMGIQRQQVYIANIVKCRPPANRVPEPVEANTCSQFLLRQIDIVQPKVIVALGATAATYLLGVKQSLAGLRGNWHSCRGAKLVVTYHPAFLLRDPRQKGEAWKDLQMVMKEMGLKAPARG